MGTPRERLAEQLKQARIDAGFTTHTALARELQLVRPVIGKAENPRNPAPSIDTITRWAKACKVDPGPLIDLAERCKSGNPEWFVPYARAEHDATSLRLWGPLLVPGLAQTEGYARSVLEIGGHVGARLEELVTARMERQKVIGRARVTIVIDHAALERPLGSPHIMAEQCEKLIDLVESGLARVHIVPYGKHVGLYGAFSIATRNGVNTVNLNALRDVSSTDHALGEEALGAFDDILASSLPRAESLDWLRSQRDKWRDQP